MWWQKHPSGTRSKKVARKGGGGCKNTPVGPKGNAAKVAAATFAAKGMRRGPEPKRAGRSCQNTSSGPKGSRGNAVKIAAATVSELKSLLKPELGPKGSGGNAARFAATAKVWHGAIKTRTEQSTDEGSIEQTRKSQECITEMLTSGKVPLAQQNGGIEEFPRFFIRDKHKDSKGQTSDVIWAQGDRAPKKVMKILAGATTKVVAAIKKTTRGRTSTRKRVA